MALIVATIALLLMHFPRESEQVKSYRFGTKTAYRYNSTGNSSTTHPQGCTPVHLNMVLRHGSRFPSDGDWERVDDLLKKLNAIYNTSSPFRYKNLTIPWSKPLEWSDAKPKELSSVGENEQYDIAKRFRSRYGHAFDRHYWNKYYKFVARDKRRTAQSAVAFAYGLFENDGRVGNHKFQPVVISFAGREENDRLLSSYDACPRYQIDVKKHGVGEVDKFIKGPEIINVTRRLEERLRLTGKTSLTFDDAKTILRLCAFGVMNRQDNRWCALLTDEDVDVLAYASDLENYYEHSYGNKLSYEIICVLHSDMIEGLEDFSKGKSDLRGVFRFASSGTLFSLLTMLGRFEGASVLRADNYKENIGGKFTSNIVTMSTNVALVLYKCNSTEQAGEEEYKVQILVNEKPVGLPCCHGNSTCDLDEFLSYFKKTVDECDFDAMCSLPSTVTPTTPRGTAFVCQFQVWTIVFTLLVTMFLNVQE